MTARPEEHADLANRLGFHAATEVTGPMHDAVRASCLNLGHWLLDVLPAGRHRSLALTALQETMMWANAAVACDQPAEPELFGGATPVADAPGCSHPECVLDHPHQGPALVPRLQGT